ncbi:hypothetical protein [Nocardia seriolae]|uniref:DUF8176 domain-containing protein n=1 Tax=Nocardia seriolae TaxID=37332 RepID=A0A0B8NI30_9NOCA|nr:hypothetical protein [Nocardia seriolae]APA99855.1 hypothetical protein NS506_05818 [Nocardia seriolae]MTJ64549.1 hypothetical protein [Nocardia seriolae]MTJ73385.1 hypothetical protein [Nocardia seriolae]MTJ89392.1 hypothetical protein [Nocardia seriolae]MTK33368.1 hypothetical protein [Nocardia seriolae]
MSTTESDSRTTDPLEPDHDGAYTGSWSDWITGTPAPARGGRRDAYTQEYESYDEDETYDEYGDFDDEDDYEPHPRTTESRAGAEQSQPGAGMSRPRDEKSRPAGEGSRSWAEEPRSSGEESRSGDEWSRPSGPAASPAHAPDRPIRARTIEASPRARTAYDVLRERASFDPAAQHAPGDRLDPPPGYPTARRPLKRATRTGPARRGLGISLDLGGRQWAVPLLGLLAVLAVTAAVAVQIAKMTGDSTPAKPGVATPQAAVSPTAAVSPNGTVAPTASAFSQPAAGPANLCPNEVKGGNVRGNGPGSTKSGPDVILALQNRYYVDRSGKAVREMFAPDAAAPSVEQIQAGIDSIPVGTTYCVQIMPGPFDGQHVMVVNEQHPDASKRTWAPQLVITTKVGDATLISAIVPMTEDTPK